MSSDDDGFCSGPLINTTMMWNTSNPNVTQCLRDTFLVGVPASVLWVFGSVWAVARACGKRNEAGRARITVLFAFKFTLTCVLVINAVCELAARIDGAVGSLHPSDYFYPICLLASFLLSATLLSVEKRYGLHASPPQFAFYFGLMVGVAPTFKVQVETLMEQHGTDTTDWHLLLRTATSWPLIIFVLLLNCWADLDRKPGELEPMESHCSVLSRLFFSWMGGLVRKGYKTTLTFESLPTAPEDMSVTRNVQDFLKRLNPYFTRRALTGRKVSMYPVLAKAYGVRFTLTFILALVHYTLPFLSPTLLQYLIRFISSDEEMWKGYLYAGLLFG